MHDWAIVLGQRVPIKVSGKNEKKDLYKALEKHSSKNGKRRNKKNRNDPNPDIRNKQFGIINEPAGI